MEVCGVVSRQSPLCFASSSAGSCSSSSKQLQNVSGSVVMSPRRRIGGEIVISTGFCDQGHLQYYSSNPVAIMTNEKQEKIVVDKDLKKLKKKNKQQLKLLKGLSRDLSTFSEIGFGLNSDGALVDQVKGTMISEAAELLMEQLQKLRAEEKELKRKRKEEKTRLKAIQMQNRLMGCEMSSSSSESSSDSECGGVIDMNSLKTSQSNKNAMPQIIQEPLQPPATPIIPTLPSSQPIVSEKFQVPLAEDQIAKQSSCVGLCENSNSLDTSCSKRIEVCMGGKCKKSGAAELLEKFQTVVGIEGSVSGCKCMGKCRDGPNVKVVNGGCSENSVRSPNNPLCIGVGLEDVDMIVANFLGGNQNQLEFAA